MNKKIIFIMVMALMAAALGGVLFVLSRETPAAPAAVPEEEYVFSAHEPGEAAAEGPAAVSVAVEHDSGVYTIIPGEPPVISGFEGLTLDTYSLNRIISVFTKLVSRGLVTEEAAGLSVFGLDPPRARITVRMEGGEQIILIGADAPDGGSVYVKKADAPAVYLVSVTDINPCLKDPLDFVDTGITPSPEKENGVTPFEKIILGGAVRRDGAVTIVKREEAENSGAPGLIASPYRIASPVDTGLSLDRGLPPLESLFGLRASKVVARISGAADPGAFGLAEPWSTAAVSGRPEVNFSLKVSAPDGSGNVFIQREGIPLIYSAPASSLPWLGLSWFDLMDKLILIPYIDSVAAVEVKTPERSVTFSLSGEGDDLKVKAGDTAVDTAVFRAYYQTLLTAMYDEYADVSPASLASPFLEIVYRYRDSRAADTVGFYRAASRRILTSLNRGRPFYTFAAYADKVVADLDLVLKGEKVRPYL
ncbi:MAG: DUF4340 domain-containing protein [Treponema sp.]|nr:DUF4340 domain-containing protein [Treponema sp.]